MARFGSGHCDVEQRLANRVATQAAITRSGDVMDPSLHRKIADRLERAKASGLICDYLVAWVGRGGRLDPVVRGWSSAQPESAQQRVAALLAGLVSAQNVRVRTE